MAKGEAAAVSEATWERVVVAAEAAVGKAAEVNMALESLAARVMMAGGSSGALHGCVKYLYLGTATCHLTSSLFVTMDL